MKHLLFILAFICAAASVWAQPAQAPATYGGNGTRTLSLKTPENASLQKEAEYDYDKMNPRVRALAPRERKCGTVEVEKTRGMEDAGTRESTDHFEQWLDSSVTRMQQTRSVRRSGKKIYTLPVVVHVIYSNPVENITDEQVYSQIRVLNEDYRRRNPDQDRTPQAFAGLATDTDIEFCLASIDPSGRPSNGINRVSMPGAPFSERFVNETMKRQTGWDPNKYMNIWVCNLAGGILGFAQFPMSSGLSGIPASSTLATTDGVVISYNAFGTLGTVAEPFHKGRTATHEIGHWLGLRHTWGDADCAEDYCDDTPRTDGPSQACPDGKLGCDGANAMIQNYMDYTDDACMNLFTLNQKQRMIAVLENSPRRRSLLESPVCQTVAEAPTPAFTSDVTTGCGPLKVRFSDRSKGSPDEWFWSFPGGKPETSDQQNPEVIYRKGGTYPVRLTVTNAAGARTEEQLGYITVKERGEALPFVADFEDNTVFPAMGMRVVNADRDATWEPSSRVSGFGQGRGSLRIANFDNTLRNSTDWIITPALDLSSGAGSALSFQVAYSPFDDTYSDTLGVFVAAGCGAEFRNIYFRGGRELATAEPYTQTFIPIETEWRTETIDLSSYDGEPFVQVAFVNFNGNGNDLYVDNIRVFTSNAQAPQAHFAASDSSVCAGDKVTFTDLSSENAEKWVWAFPGGNPAADTTQNPVITYEQPGIYDVVLTVYGKGGSHVTTRTGLISVRQVPDLRLEASAKEVCQGQEVTLIAAGASEFIWQLGEGAARPNGNRAVVRPEKDMQYRVTSSGISGCEATASAVVRVRADRQLSVLPMEATICRGQSVSLNALGMDQYTWAPAEGLNLTTGSLVKASPRQTTIYTVTGQAGEGCIITRQVTVKVEDASSSISLVADRNALCPGESTEIRASGAAGYRWSPSATLNRSEGDVVVAKPETTTTYILTALTSAGCQVEKSITLTASPKPELRATADKSLICPNEPLRLSAYGASRLSWSPEPLIVSVSGNTASARTDRTTLFTVIGENEAGCEDTARIEVTVRQAPKLTVTPSESVICQGSQTEIKASGAVSYVWSPSEGLNTTSGDRVMARPYRSQTYTVQARDIAGCISSAQAKVTVSGAAYPVPDFSSDASENFACAGQAITFRNQSTQAYSSYWEFPGGIPATSTEQNPVVTYDSEGPKDVVLTVTGCNGLRERKVAQGYLVITPPMFFSLNTENVSVCRDEPFRLVASGAETYTWSPALGLDQTTGNVVMASPQVRSTYKVRGISRDGCVAEREVTLDVIGAGKKLKISPSAPAICQGQSTQLTASGAASYRWSPATGLDRIDGPSVQARPDRTTTYTVEGTDEDGCTFRIPVTVTVNQKNTLKISPDKPVICAGEEVVLRTSSRGVYQWAPAYGLSAATGSEIRAFPRETTTYRINGSDEHGCPAEASVTVTVQGGANVSLLARETRICEGSSTEVVISGGSSYQWSPIEGVSQGVGAVVNLAPAKTTTYTVTSGIGNCASRQTVTIEVIPSQPISILPEAPRVCPGQSIELEAVGAKAYIWDEAKGLTALAGSKVRVTPSQTTIYEVSGVDANGCEARGKATVVVGTADFLRLSASAATICKGSDVMLMAGGGESYEWIEGEGLNNRSAARVYARPLENTSYRVVATDRYGCRDTASMRLNFEELRATFDASVTEIDLAEGEGVVTFADRTPQSVEWLWDFGDGGSSREAKPAHVYDRPGTYTVRMKVSNGACEAMTSRQVRVVNSSNLEEVASSLLVTLDESDQHVGFSLESPRGMLLSMRLLDASGREQISSLLRLGKGSFSREWDLSSFGKGVYVMELTDGARSVTREVEVK